MPKSTVYFLFELSLISMLNFRAKQFFFVILDNFSAITILSFDLNRVIYEGRNILPIKISVCHKITEKLYDYSSKRIYLARIICSISRRTMPGE